MGNLGIFNVQKEILPDDCLHRLRLPRLQRRGQHHRVRADEGGAPATRKKTRRFPKLEIGISEKRRYTRVGGWGKACIRHHILRAGRGIPKKGTSKARQNTATVRCVRTHIPTFCRENIPTPPNHHSENEIFLAFEVCPPLSRPPPGFSQRHDTLLAPRMGA